MLQIQNSIMKLVVKYRKKKKNSNQYEGGLGCKVKAIVRMWDLEIREECPLWGYHKQTNKK